MYIYLLFVVGHRNIQDESVSLSGQSDWLLLRNDVIFIVNDRFCLKPSIVDLILGNVA